MKLISIPKFQPGTDSRNLRNVLFVCLLSFTLLVNCTSSEGIKASFQNNPPLDSLTSEWQNIPVPWDSKKWNEIPMTIIEGKLIFAKTKIKHPFDLDIRKGDVEYYEFDPFDGKIEKWEELDRISERFIVQDFFKSKIHGEENLYFTAKIGNKYKLFKHLGGPDAEEVKFENWKGDIINPSMNYHGDRIVFSSKKDKADYDLYVSDRKMDSGKWKKPQKLSVSSPFDELNPEFSYCLNRKNHKEIGEVITYSAPIDEIIGIQPSNKGEKLKKGNQRQFRIFPTIDMAIPTDKRRDAPDHARHIGYKDINTCTLIEYRIVPGSKHLDIMARKDTLYCPKTNYHALLIEINEFEKAPDLKEDTISSQILQRVLPKWSFQFNNIKVLKDQDATKKAIENTFEEYLKFDSTTNLLIYINTHGDTIYQDNRRDSLVWYLVPYDGDRENYKETYISQYQINSWVNDLRCRQVLLIVDACFAGNLVSSKSLGPQRHRRLISVTGKLTKILDTSCLAQALEHFLNKLNKNTYDRSILGHPNFEDAYENCLLEKGNVAKANEKHDSGIGNDGYRYFIWQRSK